MSELRRFVFKNFARSTLGAALSASATQLQVETDHGDRFPSPIVDDDEIFAIILSDGTQYEIAYCTSRGGDYLTVERGKEGTTAGAFAAGTAVVHAATAAFFEQRALVVSVDDLVAELSGIQEVTLTWNDAAPGADTYEVWRSKDGDPAVQIEADAASPYVDEDLERGSTYEYYIVANLLVGGTTESNIESVAIPVATPPVLTAEITGSGEATLTWTDAEDMVVDHYEVWRGTNGGAITLHDATATSPYVDSGLSSGTVYDYYILAVDGLATAEDEQSETESVDSSFFETFMLIHVEGGQIYEVTGFPTVTPVGDGAVSSVQAKFGTQSFLNPGTTAEGTDYVRVEGSATDFVFPGEFTFEGWFYINELTAAYDNFFANNINFPTAGFIQLASNGSGKFMFNSSAGGITDNSGDSVLTGQWIHVAVTRDASNVVRIFQNGSVVKSATISGTVGGANAGVSSFDVCRGHASDNSDLDCYFEEIRVTKACRYNAAFTPPTAPFEPYPGI